jgi:hypothetical protein
MKCCGYGSRLQDTVIISGSDLDPVVSRSLRRVRRENAGDGDGFGKTMKSSKE